MNLKRDLAELKVSAVQRLKTGADKLGSKAANYLSEQTSKIKLPTVEVEAGLNPTTMIVLIVVVVLFIFKGKF